ncbi:MAG: hypothetical protein ACPL0G_07250 [Infirmifilum uzonense]
MPCSSCNACIAVDSPECRLRDSVKDNKARIHRGLYVCKNCGIAINANINAALNIAKKAGYNQPKPNKIETFLYTRGGATPLAEKKGKITLLGAKHNPSEG